MEEDPAPWHPVRSSLRWVPGLLVLLVAVFLSFFEQFFLPVSLPVLGTRALQPIRAPYDFVFNEQQALEDVVEQELEDFIPVFRYDPKKTSQTLAELESFFQGVEECRTGPSQRGDTPEKCVRALFGSSSDASAANGGVAELLRFPHLDSLKGLLTTVLTDILKEGVYSEEEVPADLQVLRVLYSDSSEPVRRSVGQLMSLSKARETLKDRLSLLRLNDVLQEVLHRKAKSLIEPSLYYSPDNEKRVAAIRELKSSRTAVLYRRGDLLVPRGHKVDRLDVYRVQACLSKERPDLLLVGMGSFIPFFVLTFLFVLSLQRVQGMDPGSSRPYLLVFFVLLAVLLISKAIYLFTNLTGFAMPIATAGLLLVLLLELPTALLATILTALYTTFLTSLDMGLFVYYLIGGVLMVVFSRRGARRFRLFSTSLLVGLINAFIVGCILLLRDEAPTRAMLEELVPQAFLSAPAAWLIAMLFIPMTERIFRLASSDRLRELADLNQPLLKKLMDKAPGTYYHSLSVANLACAAASAVKADVLLTRVGAYYHDIGKLLQPEYFIENQDGKNPHDTLDPMASYAIVKAHTRDGAGIASEHRFPQAVIDFVAEHHGTTVMEAFFSKAQQASPDVPCNRDFFRYDGPKPSRIESAILMIADIVEAMARVTKSRQPAKVREMVHKVVVSKFDDGQFDRCGLDTHTLPQIESAITQTILGFLHKRIEYPEQEQAQEPSSLAD
ncbi:MAG: HDIG domain-containing metalloprotein [bacterium]